MLVVPRRVEPGRLESTAPFQVPLIFALGHVGRVWDVCRIWLG